MCSVKWDCCQYGMVWPHFTVGDGLQIWKVVVNVLDKQSQTADVTYYKRTSML
jgi:hypothetical protein